MRLDGPGRALAGALVAGLLLRAWGLDFGLPNTAARPDESVLVHRALAIAGGEWNPHFFNYPSLPLYLLALVFGVQFLLALASGTVEGTQAFLQHVLVDPSDLYLAGRWLTALLGTATVAWTWRLGRGVGGPAAAAAAAILLAAAFLHARDSHFLTVDVPAAFWVTASLAVAVDGVRRAGGRRLLLAAALMGLAVSTKYNAALFVPALAVAGWLAPGEDRLRRVAMMLAVTAAAFLCGSPYVALDAPAFWQDFGFEWSHFGRGHTGQTLGNGWLYHLGYTLRHGLGLPLLLAALASLAVLAWRRRPADRVLLTAVLAYYAVAGGGRSLFVRYAIPLVPLLCVAAGAGLAWLTRGRTAVAAALAVGLALPSAAATVSFDRILARQDTREQARRWIEAHVPDGARVALTGSQFGWPQLWPSRPVLERRLAAARRQGQTGRRLSLLLDMPGGPPRPAYDLVDLGHGTWRLPALKAAGIAWLVTQTHPLAYAGMPPGLGDDLAGLDPAADFDPAPGADLAAAAFDPLDAWYVPYAGAADSQRPGPRLRVYRLQEGPPNPAGP